jgi:hypothetical protein
VIGLLVAAPLIALGIGWFIAEAVDVFSCGGDGGLPYAAPSSPQGKFCDGLFQDLKALFIAAPGGVVGAGAAAFGRVRRWRPFGATCFAGLAIAFAPLITVATLDEHCPGSPYPGAIPPGCEEA